MDRGSRWFIAATRPVPRRVIAAPLLTRPRLPFSRRTTSADIVATTVRLVATGPLFLVDALPVAIQLVHDQPHYLV